MSLTLQHHSQLHGDLLDVLGIESHETVELGTVWESRECCSQMDLSVAVEVPLAGEPRPPSEDGQGDDFALGEGGWRSGASLLGGVRLAEVIHDDVEYGEEGVHIEHVESAPFPSGLVGKPTLIRGHLPLKSSPCNSHQAFKSLEQTTHMSRVVADPKLFADHYSHPLTGPHISSKAVSLGSPFQKLGHFGALLIAQARPCSRGRSAL